MNYIITLPARISHNASSSVSSLSHSLSTRPSPSFDAEIGTVFPFILFLFSVTSRLLRYCTAENITIEQIDR